MGKYMAKHDLYTMNNIPVSEELLKNAACEGLEELFSDISDISDDGLKEFVDEMDEMDEAQKRLVNSIPDISDDVKIRLIQLIRYTDRLINSDDGINGMEVVPYAPFLLLTMEIEECRGYLMDEFDIDGVDTDMSIVTLSNMSLGELKKVYRKKIEYLCQFDEVSRFNVFLIIKAAKELDMIHRAMIRVAWT